MTPEYKEGDPVMTVGDFLTAMMAKAIKEEIEKNIKENNGLDIDKLSIEIARQVMKGKSK